MRYKTRRKMSNMVLLFKNIIFKIKSLNISNAAAFIFLFFLVYSIQVFWLVNFIRTFKYIIAIFFILSGISSLYCLLKFKISGKILRLIVLWLISLPVFFILFKFRNYNPFISNDNIKLLTVFLLNLIIFYAFYITKPLNSNLIAINNKMMIIISFTGFFFLFFYQPFYYYMSSSSDMGISLASFLPILVSVFAMPFGVLILLFYFLPLRYKHFLAHLILFMLVASFIFSNVLKVNTGLLDAVTFYNEQAIFEMPLLFYLIDPFIITGLWVLSGYLIKNKEKILIFSCLIFIFVMFFSITTKLIKTDFNTLFASQNKNTELLTSSYKNHIFSQEGKNIVFIIADMFNGNYFGKILNEDIKYSEIFSGFSYYPDCLAPASFTAASLPAIFAGHDYTPELLNTNGKIGSAEINEASYMFFSQISNSNYNITITNPLFFHTNIGEIEDQKNYVNYWKNKNNYESTKDYYKFSVLFMLSVFNSAPYHFKYAIYDKSSWIILRKSALLNGIKNRTIENLAYIDLLPEISSVENKKNQFFYIHNNLTHAPYGIGHDSNPIKDVFPDNDSNFTNSSIAAYLSAKKFIDIIGNWLLWMKDNNVYDNTAIIILSDHGNSFNDNDIKLPKQLNDIKNIKNVSRAQALLLVKGFKSSGNAVINPERVYLADIPAILENEAGIKFLFERIPYTADNKKFIYSVSNEWNHFLDVDTIKYKSYEVKGSIFIPDSWNIYDNKKK